MKIISTTDLSREGNDCYIYESVSLVEMYGMYTVIIAKRISGWCANEEINCMNPIDLYEAKRMYKQYGGILED